MDNLTIINLALAHLGAALIQNIDEKSKEAAAAKQFYDPTRRSVLRKYNWNFATKTERLALLAEKPVRYEYAYGLPADYVKLINIAPKTEHYLKAGNEEPFKIQDNKLLCDLEEVYVDYIYDNINENSFDDLFVEAFSHLLASKMAVNVTGDTDLMKTNLALYEGLIDDAAVSSINESKEEKEVNPYVDARW
jgi:hypothetical protein